MSEYLLDIRPIIRDQRQQIKDLQIRFADAQKAIIRLTETLRELRAENATLSELLEKEEEYTGRLVEEITGDYLRATCRGNGCRVDRANESQTEDDNVGPIVHVTASNVEVTQ